jgi:hypothetical protein
MTASKTDHQRTGKLLSVKGDESGKPVKDGVRSDLLKLSWREFQYFRPGAVPAPPLPRFQR